MPSDAPRSPGRVPVAIYIASPGGDPDAVLETHCRQFAESREWVVSAVFTDQGQVPLEDRAGWLALRDALGDGVAQGVVTWTRSMVADSTEGWERLAVGVSELGWFLVAGALDTPGHSLYGRTRTEQLPNGRRLGTRRATGTGAPRPQSGCDPGP
ncbi:hypothetical protein [Kitasatospora sp. NRRL B-11411]|uniref:hypothetical protein n=1 Tax=Kitasatospora sp. NRRL B-11411 TaxID=1463822 RepID=UPI0004C2D891|nr:hypothetical protein [Kitasatospora sp. NRRL B-11411]